MHVKPFHLFQTSPHPPYSRTSIPMNMCKKWVYKKNEDMGGDEHEWYEIKNGVKWRWPCARERK